MTLAPVKSSFTALMALCLSAVVSSQFAIPARYDGFALSGPKSTRPIVIEAFYDLLCPGCKDGWPILKNVSAVYSQDKVQVIVHPFPAPFHHNAFFAARGMHIAALLNASLAYPWLELVYKFQDQFSGDATELIAPKDILVLFSKLATKLGLDKAAFLKGYSDPRTDSLTRTSFKYGCHRGVVATPTYLVNGVTVLGADDTWTVARWQKLLDPLVYAAEAASKAEEQSNIPVFGAHSY
eukprot:jgi/Mesen1/10549/ME000083S10059